MLPIIHKGVLIVEFNLIVINCYNVNLTAHLTFIGPVEETDPQIFIVAT